MLVNDGIRFSNTCTATRYFARSSFIKAAGGEKDGLKMLADAQGVVSRSSESVRGWRERCEQSSGANVVKESRGR